MPLIVHQFQLLSLPLGSSHLLMILPYRKRSQTLYSMAMVHGPAWDDQDPDDCQLQAWVTFPAFSCSSRIPVDTGGKFHSLTWSFTLWNHDS